MEGDPQTQKSTLSVDWLACKVVTRRTEPVLYVADVSP